MSKVLKRSTRKVKSKSLRKSTRKVRKSPRKVKSKSPRKVKSKSPRKVKSKSPRKVKSKSPRKVKSKSPRKVKSKSTEKIRSSIRKVNDVNDIFFVGDDLFNVPSPKKSPKMKKIKTPQSDVPKTPDYPPPRGPDVIIKNFNNKKMEDISSLRQLYQHARKMYKTKKIVFYNYKRCCVDNDHVFNNKTKLTFDDIENLRSYDKTNQIEVYMKMKKGK